MLEEPLVNDVFGDIRLQLYENSICFNAAPDKGEEGEPEALERIERVIGWYNKSYEVEIELGKVEIVLCKRKMDCLMHSYVIDRVKVEFKDKRLFREHLKRISLFFAFIDHNVPI